MGNDRKKPVSAAAGSARSTASRAGRKAGRPRSRVLSRELILETALLLMDEHGETTLGMRSIAHRLGVQPSSLYNHVSGRPALISGVRELITDRMDVACFDELPWDAALHRWADSYRAAFAAHPATVALLATTPLDPESRSSAMYDAVVAGLVRGGWPRSAALSVIVAVEDFLLGAALDTAADPEMLDPGEGGPHASFEAAYRARGEELAARGITPADAAYRIGLGALVAGLRLELERETTGEDPERRESEHEELR